MRVLLLVVLIALGAAVPAAAATMRAVYSGTLSDGTDDVGIFGVPNADLAGAAFVAVFIYDTRRGQRSTVPGLSDGLSGGSAGIGSNPVLSASLTVNGITYAMAPSVWSTAGIATDGLSRTFTEHRADDRVSVGSVETLADTIVIGLRSPVVAVPDLARRVTLDDDDTFFQGGFVFVRVDATTGQRIRYASGRFFTDRVRVAPVPLPAAAAPLAGGIVVLAAAGRRRRRPAD